MVGKYNSIPRLQDSKQGLEIEINKLQTILKNYHEYIVDWNERIDMVMKKLSHIELLPMMNFLVALMILGRMMICNRGDHSPLAHQLIYYAKI